MSKETLLIEAIKNDNQKVLRDLYIKNRTSFFSYCHRFQLDKAIVADIYQDAFVALCENAKKGKIDQLNSTLTTYIIGIGKFMVYQYLKKNKQIYTVEDFSDFEIEYETYDEEQLQVKTKLIRTVLAQMGEQCKKVLELFYYEEKKLEEIQQILSYSNKDVLKSQKSRCLKQLKDLVNKK